MQWLSERFFANSIISQFSNFSKERIIEEQNHIQQSHSISSGGGGGGRSGYAAFKKEKKKKARFILIINIIYNDNIKIFFVENYFGYVGFSCIAKIF